jgi:hypothetical protein
MKIGGNEPSITWALPPGCINPATKIPQFCPIPFQDPNPIGDAPISDTACPLFLSSGRLLLQEYLELEG